ncbi:MAG: serine/threonine protein kinase [Planctomycetota bacterium]|nr:serine/threonine protein kinase [Planctomycetota bacterium]
MATSVESNPPAKGTPPTSGPSSPPPAPVSQPPVKAATATPAAKSDAKARSDPKGLSAINDTNLERTIIRRGLATLEEINHCKAQRSKIAAAKEKEQAIAPSLLEVLVAAKALTASQARRIVQEVGTDGEKKFEVPGYQILERIGKGSMGLVYKAKQASVNRVVAVKVLLDALAQNKEFIKRFRREAEIAAKLSHNNIVGVIDAGEVANHHYFVMEYIEGETIKDLLEKGKIFDEKVALKIVLAVAEALAHAHTRGLIHRDVKPENVILTKDGNVKLADLGLARPTADEKWAMSEAGMAIGTPYYISPEQVRGQVDVDIRADIYGLGATLYHMVTGQVPYTGETPNDVMKKHVDKNVILTPPDHLNTRLSSGIGEVVETMMAKNRENRYRNPEDLILDLKCLVQGETPMIAAKKSDSLANLAEGDLEEGVAGHSGGGGGASETEKQAMAAIVNSRSTVIAVLAILLGVSAVTNVLFFMIK